MTHRISFSGFLNKKSRYRKKWRRRYFIIQDGIMKYYVASDDKNSQSGSGLKGIFDLTGAHIRTWQDSPNMLELKLPQDHGNEIVLDATSDEMFQQLHATVVDGVKTRNILALSNGSRLPEVVDWYYQQQAEFYEQMKILEAETKFVLQAHLDPPSSAPPTTNGGASLQHHCTLVKVVVNKDQTGLLFRVEAGVSQSKFRRPGSTPGSAGGGRHLSRLEAMIDGRVVHFRDLSRVKWRQAGYTDRDDGLTTGANRAESGLFGDTRNRGESSVSNLSSGDECDGSRGVGGPAVAKRRAEEDADTPTGSSEGGDVNSGVEIMSGASTMIMGMHSFASPVSGLGRGDMTTSSGYRSSSVSSVLIAPTSTEILLITSEDELVLTQLLPSPGSGSGVPQPSLDHMRAWYEAIRSAASFVSVPAPTSTLRAAAAGTRASSSAAAVHYGFFSMNSGLVFSCAGDVAVLLKSFDMYGKNLPAISTLSSLLTDIFKLIPNVQCNKEGASNFGERLEDVVRVLGDAKSGVLSHTPLSESAKVNDRIVDLCEETRDAKVFLQSIASPGWLQVVTKPPKHTLRNTLRYKMSGKDSPKSQVREKFEYFDRTITSLSNQLVKRYGDSTWVFKKKAYDLVVDVGHCVDALGGAAVIYNDSAKVRALARLIQADGSELQRELLEMLDTVKGRKLSLEGGGCGLILRTLCCGICLFYSDREGRHMVTRSHSQKPRTSATGSLDMSLLTNEHEAVAKSSAQSKDTERERVGAGRDQQLMSVDSDFGEHPSTRFAGTSYYDDDSVSNASSAGEYIPPHTQPTSVSHHHRIITPERTQPRQTFSSVEKSPPNLLPTLPRAQNSTPH